MTVESISWDIYIIWPFLLSIGAFFIASRSQTREFMICHSLIDCFHSDPSRRRHWKRYCPINHCEVGSWLGEFEGWRQRNSLPIVAFQVEVFMGVEIRLVGCCCWRSLVGAWAVTGEKDDSVRLKHHGHYLSNGQSWIILNYDFIMQLR